MQDSVLAKVNEANATFTRSLRGSCMKASKQRRSSVNAFADAERMIDSHARKELTWREQEQLQTVFLSGGHPRALLDPPSPALQLTL